MTGWTTPADIAARVRKRWDDGSLLRGWLRDEPFPTVEVPLRRPTASQIGDDLTAVREWAAALDAGRQANRCYGLTYEPVGGRYLGKNEIPARAVVSTYDQAWRLLGVRKEADRARELAEQASGVGAARAWLLAKPHRALAIGDDWPGVLAAFGWLDEHRGSGRYLREISAPGVDTKFAERHRSTLAAMLGVSGSATGFLTDLGLATKPDLLRLRLSPSVGRPCRDHAHVGRACRDLAFPEGLTDLALRADEAQRLDLTPTRVLVCENEITYLSVPIPDGGLVFWGHGYDVDRVGRLPWLDDVPIDYWGDLDTHGFAILDRLRAFLPQTRSVLMDSETLLEHRDRWGTESKPTTAGLSRLTDAEQTVYSDLVSDRFGDRIRLEQERIDWAWALRSLRLSKG